MNTANQAEQIASSILNHCKTHGIKAIDLYKDLSDISKAYDADFNHKYSFALQKIKKQNIDEFENTIQSLCLELKAYQPVNDLLFYSLVTDCDLNFFNQVSEAFIKLSNINRINIAASSEDEISNIKEIINNTKQTHIENSVIDYQIDEKLISGWKIIINNKKTDCSVSNLAQGIKNTLI